MPVIKSACIFFILHSISECANTEQIFIRTRSLENFFEGAGVEPLTFRTRAGTANHRNYYIC